MKKSGLLFCLLMAVSFAWSQTDFLLLKKRDRTIATYFSGTYIQFITHSGAEVDGVITQLRNDSIFLRQVIARQVPTSLGVYVIDTSQVYYYQFHYKQIKSVSTIGRRFNWGASGGTLMGGGVVLAAASGIVFLVDNKKFSPSLLASAAVLTGVGYLMMKSDSKGKTIGKKYAFVYVNNQPGSTTN